MKIACLAFMTAIALVNVIAGLKQAWVLFRKRIYQCPGCIVASRVGGAQEWQSGSDKLAMFWPEVEYEYDPSCGKLTGNRISMVFTKTSDRAKVEKKVSYYPVGKAVRVFYNADDFTDAYLKNPRKQISTSLVWAFGMIVFGALMDFMIWKILP